MQVTLTEAIYSLGQFHRIYEFGPMYDPHFGLGLYKFVLNFPVFPLHINFKFVLECFTLRIIFMSVSVFVIEIIYLLAWYFSLVNKILLPKFKYHKWHTYLYRFKFIIKKIILNCKFRAVLRLN